VGALASKSRLGEVREALRAAGQLSFRACPGWYRRTRHGHGVFPTAALKMFPDRERRNARRAPAQA